MPLHSMQISGLCPPRRASTSAAMISADFLPPTLKGLRSIMLLILYTILFRVFISTNMLIFETPVYEIDQTIHVNIDHASLRFLVQKWDYVLQYGSIWFAILS